MRFIGSDQRAAGGGRRRRRRRIGAVLVSAMVVIAACGDDDDDDDAETSTEATSGVADQPRHGGDRDHAARPQATSDSVATTEQTEESTAPAGPAPADDIGITDTEIHVAILADVQTAVNPGLFQKNIDVMNAWAEIVNENGGLAGRQVVVDATDTKLDPNESKNAAINACANDFAMVGTAALVLVDMSDVESCPNAEGEAVGIPNVAGISFGPQQSCSPMTLTAQSNNGTYCATKDDPEQTYTVLVGDVNYFLSQYDDLHGIWVYNSDVPTARTTQLPTYMAGSDAGHRGRRRPVLRRVGLRRRRRR